MYKHNIAISSWSSITKFLYIVFKVNSKLI